MNLGKHHTTTPLLTLIVLSHFCTGVSWAQSANLLSNTDFMQGPASWTVPRVGERSQVTYPDVVAGPFRRAIHVDITPHPGDLPLAVRLIQPLSTSLVKGDSLVLRFWARSDDGNKINACIEDDSTPHAKSAQATLNLTDYWKEYEVKGTALDGYAAMGARVAFEMAYGPGSIEITGIRVTRNAPDPLKMPSNPLSTRTNTVQLVRPELEPANRPLPVNPPLASPMIVSPPEPDHTGTRLSGAALVKNGDFSAPTKDTWMLYGQYDPTAQVVPFAVSSYSQCAHIVTAPTGGGEAEGSILAARRVEVPLVSGEVVAVRFWAKSSDHCRLRVVFQLADPPYDKSMLREIRLAPEWKEYRFYARTSRDFDANTADFEIHLGLDKGAVDITGIRVENFGKQSLSSLEDGLGPQTF